MSCKIKTKKYDNVYLLKLSGEIEAPDINTISKKLESLLNSKYHTIAIDLNEVKYIDSHGLGVFVYYWKMMEKNDRELVFVKPSGVIKTIFEGTNLDQILNIVDSPEDL